MSGPKSKWSSRVLALSFLTLCACGGGTGASGASSGESSTTSGTSSNTSSTTQQSTEPSNSTGASVTGTETSAGDTVVVPTDCHRPVVSGADPSLVLEAVATGFNQPLFVLGDPIDLDTLYVLERGGSIKRLAPSEDIAPSEDWLSLSVSTAGEMGLLGMAFHPEYAENSLVYVLYSDTDASWRITEFMVEDGLPNPASARDVLASAQPGNTHNGGMIQFGPDEMLYVSIGDGGPADDGCSVGQDPGSLLGTVLRIDPTPDGEPDSSAGCGTCVCDDVDGFDYSVPKDNPFVGEDGIDSAVYAYGFRNPWRFSFDPETDQLYLADVGQGQWEEVDVIEAGGNYGWSAMTGNHCFQGACDTSAGPGETNANGFVAPVAEYEHIEGRCAIAGLGVYRSCEVPAFDGFYFYADYCTTEIWAVSYDGKSSEVRGPLGITPSNMQPLGGGYNERHDVFVAGSPVEGGPGTVYRITAR